VTVVKVTVAKLVVVGFWDGVEVTIETLVD
jgi:hypothetical protein